MRETGTTLQVDATEQLLERAVLRLNANILGIVLGIIAWSRNFCRHELSDSERWRSRRAASCASR